MRIWRQFGIWALTGLLGVAGVQPVAAQNGGTGVRVENKDTYNSLTGMSEPLPAFLSAQEQEAIKAMRAQKYIRARETAEALLKQDANNIYGMWVLGAVFLFAEGRQERARFYIDKAEAELAKRLKGGAEPALEDLYKDLKLLQLEVYGQLEEHNQRLKRIDEFQARFPSYSVDHMRIWSLMALGRYDEAESLARQKLHSTDIFDRTTAHNSLIVLYDYLGDLKNTEMAVQNGITATSERSCIIFHNGAQIALMMQKPDLAIERARKAMRAEIEDCPFSSYGHLTAAYLFKGEYMRAMSAFKALRRQPLRPDQVVLFENSVRVELVQLLLLMGKGEEALEPAKVLYTQPARLAMTSLKPNEDAVRAVVLYWLALELSKRSSAERWHTREFPERLEELPKLIDYQLRQWELKRRFIQLVSEPGLLERMQRHYLRELQPWFIGRFGSMLGYGIASAGLTRAQSMDAYEPERFHAYYQALRGEYAFLNGQYDKAIEFGSQAFKNLSNDLLTLRHRTAAYLASAYYQLGQGQSAIAVSMYHEALRNLPSALREFDAPIPVRIDFDGPEWIKETAQLLRQSPRVVLTEGAPFVLSVSGDNNVGNVCLSTSDGFRFHCVSYPSEDDPKEESDQKRKMGLVDAFHQRGFTPLVDMTSKDIHSLDGSPSRVGADDVLKGILGTSKAKDLAQ